LQLLLNGCCKIEKLGLAAVLCTVVYQGELVHLLIALYLFGSEVETALLLTPFLPSVHVWVFSK